MVSVTLFQLEFAKPVNVTLAPLENPLGNEPAAWTTQLLVTLVMLVIVRVCVPATSDVRVEMTLGVEVVRLVIVRVVAPLLRLDMPTPPGELLSVASRRSVRLVIVWVEYAVNGDTGRVSSCSSAGEM